MFLCPLLRCPFPPSRDARSGVELAARAIAEDSGAELLLELLQVRDEALHRGFVPLICHPKAWKKAMKIYENELQTSIQLRHVV